MKKIVVFFKNRIVISIIGLIVLSLLIWFVGPQIKFGTGNVAPLGGVVARLVTIMVIVILWGLNNLRLAYQDKKNNESLVDDLQDSQGGGNSVISEQSSEEMHVIGQRFAQAMATLKNLKFKGGRGRKALYELPWYIIIGPPGSGKTTALVNSSLEFPLADKFGKEALRGVGGTRNCDWWFTNEAVLIDTAGRYTTQDSHKVIDSAAWDGFLGMLRKHRRRRPINGAIVAISLQDLLTQTEEQRVAHARTIRSRLDELMSKLEIRFPIYLVFTKSDLVSGFNEYFEELSKDDREQVWGVSLPNSPGASDSPDFDFLADEYDSLVKRLYNGVITRMHQERDPNRRAAIESFPQQMENLKDIAVSFVKQAFVKNRYQFQPYLRGVYFTSGTQDGTPIDRLMSSVSANFGFNRQAMSAVSGMGKSYFLGRLFRNVIFPESELVGANRRYESFMRWTQRAGYVGLSVITGGLILTWAGSFTRNEMYMHQVQGYISDYHAEQKHLHAWSSDLQAILPSLNALAGADKVYSKEAHPWLAGMGMYDSAVDESAGKAYRAKLQTMYLPALLKYMEKYIRRGQKYNRLYDDFRIYMMFHKTDHMDKVSVRSWFEKRWQEQFAHKKQMRDDLEMHLAALLKLNIKPSALNKTLVASVRNRLLSVPLAKRVYNKLRTNPDYASKVDLVNNFGDSVRTDFVMNNHVQQSLTIPALYTKQVYNAIDFTPKSEMIQKLAHENWVLSDNPNDQGELSEDKLKQVSRKVKQYYCDEYRAYWENVYKSLKISPFQNLQQANDVLLSFIDPVYSPLVSVLRVGAENTTLTNQAAADMAENNKDGLKGKAMKVLASHVPLTSVDKQFRELNQLSRTHGDRPPGVQNLVQKLRQLQEFVNGILLAPEPGKKAYAIAKARYQSGSGNAMTSLVTYADTLPEPVSRWMHTLENQTWKVILRSAHGYVSNAWHEQIYTACNSALADRYPFVKDSRDEASMLDFTDFFKPGGTMDKFAKQYIKPFIDMRGHWSNKGVDHYSIGYSPRTLSQIKTAKLIQSEFFRQNPAVPTLSFKLRPYRMKKSDEKFTLEFGEKNISYSHGPKFWSSLKWMGGQDNTRIRLIFEDLSGGQHVASYDGPWSLFKLQDNSRIIRTSSANVYLATFSVSDESGTDSTHSISYEIKPMSVLNPLNKNLLRQFQCTDRI